MVSTNFSAIFRPVFIVIIESGAELTQICERSWLLAGNAMFAIIVRPNLHQSLQQTALWTHTRTGILNKHTAVMKLAVNIFPWLFESVEVVLNEERDTDSGTYIGFGRDVNSTPKAQSHAPCFTFLFRRHKLRQEISFETFILKKEMHGAH